MNNADIAQLILSFELQGEKRDNMVLLSAFDNEREYFATKKGRDAAFPVRLPDPFQETALMDSRNWRKNLQTSFLASDLGRRMWLELPGHLRRRISFADIGSSLRVAIASHSNGLDDIPWEWLGGPNNEPLAADDRLRFVRLVPTLYAPPPLSLAPPIRVLLVLTNPKDERLLQPNIEIEVVTSGLYNTPDYQVRVALEPRLDALKREMEWSPHIIHYIGHAGISGNKGCLIIHNDSEGTRWLPAEEAVHFIPSSVRLVCLSTCVTAENYQIGGLNKFAHCPAEIALPTAIVNQYALTREDATVFWSSFYPALIRRGGDVAEAFHEARRAVRNPNKPNDWGWASFSLVVRDGSGIPMRIGKTAKMTQNRFEAEIKAQWTARLANNLAERLSTLDSKYQEHWETSVAEEVTRLEGFEKDLVQQEEAEKE